MRLAVRRVLAVAGICALLSLPALAGPQGSDLATAYVERLEATLQVDADDRALDELLELYAVDAVYEHPLIGARVAGADSIREAMRGFLGTTRDPKITLLDRIDGPGVIVLQLHTEAYVVSSGEPIDRTSIVILEVADGLIHRILDHW